MASEDAYAHERVLAAALLERAGPGQVWIGDRHFCPGARLRGWDAAGAGFIVREHANHPRLRADGPWHEAGRTGTGSLREQIIALDPAEAQPDPEHAIGRQRRRLLRQCPGGDDQWLVQGGSHPPTRAVALLRSGRVRYPGLGRYNHRRLLVPIGNVPPAEAEARYHTHVGNQALAA